MNELEFKFRLGYEYAVSYVMPFAKKIIMDSLNEEVYMFVNADGYIECIGGGIPVEKIPNKCIFHLGREDRERFKRLLEEGIDQYIENCLTRWQRKRLEKYSKKHRVHCREAFSIIYAEGRLYVEREVWESVKYKIMQDISDALSEYYY